MKNWRTTVLGILGGVVIILTQIVAVLDSDPATTFQLEAIFGALAAMGLGWFAKDAGVTGTEK